MALEGSHIKFALRVKDKYQIIDLSQYLSGAIYPDSRYLTGIDRELTHNNEILKKEWADTDFKKGWQSHYFFDVITVKARMEIFPNIFKNDFGQKEFRNISTALKIVQDIDDSMNLSVKDYLRYLNYFNSPNNESLEKIKKYNKLVKDMYLDKNNLIVEDYFDFLFGLGVDRKTIDDILFKAKKIVNDNDFVEKIKKYIEYCDVLSDKNFNY